jgi:hypothetical protein
MAERKTFNVVPIKAGRWADPRGYEVSFLNATYRTPQAVAKFLPQQWGDLETARVKAAELAALLNREIEVVPHDPHVPWSPDKAVYRPVKVEADS